VFFFLTFATRDAFGAEANAGVGASSSLMEFYPRADFSAALGFLPDKQNQYTIAGAAVAFSLARSNDESSRIYFAGQKRIGNIDSLGNDMLGTGVPGALIGVGAWTWGIKRQSVTLVHFAQANLEAMLVTGVVSAALKGAVGRERPDQSDRFSFPSAHTSTVAATAMTVFEFYGWRAGVPAFFLTGLTAVGRMSTDRHWLSDTVGGATLGVVFGHVFARAHLEKLKPDSLKSQSTPNGIPRGEGTRILSKLRVFPALDEAGGMRVVAVSLF
jgi:membrane-associated phospholipid phosphatase